MKTPESGHVVALNLDRIRETRWDASQKLTSAVVLRYETYSAVREKEYLARAPDLTVRMGCQQGR